MEYKYYDSPLDIFSSFPELEPRATYEQMYDLYIQSIDNGDKLLATCEYELHFGSVHDLSPGCLAEGLSDGDWALMHGGPVAVYRECLRRNMTVNQLWGYDEPERTLEQVYGMPHEKCIARIKKWRDETLEEQRKRQEAQK